MSLAVTDLMVAVLVMPVGILTLVKGEFPFAPVYCLAWICLDVLFCTASIMHLCTISVDRYLSLRYPMKFGRNKTRRRVILKIVFVWLLSIAMSLPLSLMYSKDFNSVLVNGSCQIPDPLYKLIGSIVSFYIPLGVMILTYTLTVRHLAAKRQNLQTGITHNSSKQNTARKSWRRMLQRRNYRRTRSDETDIRSATREELSGAMAGTPRSGTNDCRSQSGGHERTGPQAAATISVAEAVATAAAKWGGNNSRPVAVDHDDDDDGGGGQYDDGGLGDDGRHGDDRRHRQLVTPSASCRSTPLRHNPSVGSADTEMTSLDTRELWLPDTEPTPSTMSALHQFGAEMLRLSRGLEKVASPDSKPASPDRSYRLSGDDNDVEYDMDDGLDDELDDDLDDDLLDEESGGGGVPFTDGGCDSICSEEVTGTPRCRRVKRQRRRRRRRSGTLHESMRRRFDGHGHRYPPPHPYFRHPHQQKNHLQSPHHTDSRPTRVRSFHEDELRRNRIESPVIVTTEDNIETIAVTGPKIVGTLLKQEYQRKPGLEEEICLLPPPPRRRRRRCSASTSSGDTTGTPSPHPTPRWPVEQTPPPLAREPTHQPQQLTAAQPDNQPKRHDMLQQTAVAATRRADTIAEWSAVANTSKTTLVVDCGKGGLPLRRAMTQKLIRKRTLTMSTPSGKRHSPLMRYGSTLGLPASQQQQHQTSPMTSLQRSTNNNNSRSSVMIRNSYRHGRIIRLEQKATKVLGVVFFTFVFLWTPFFALNLLPSVCPNCEANTNKGLIDLVTWLGYASSMVNPVFYTIFNKVFRQAFKRVLLCKYRGRNKRHSWPPPPPIRKV